MTREEWQAVVWPYLRRLTAIVVVALVIEVMLAQATVPGIEWPMGIGTVVCSYALAPMYIKEILDRRRGV